jgi:hypothetical protein
MLIRLGGCSSPAISLSDAGLLSISLRASWDDRWRKTRGTIRRQAFLRATQRLSPPTPPQEQDRAV